MTATTIDYTNLYSQPSINIFTILDTRSNVADPRDGTGARKFVYDSDPLQKSFDFDGIPYIVCEDAKLDTPSMKNANARKQRLNWSQSIIIRTIKDGSSGSRTDAGVTDMRTIVDSVFQTFNDKTVKQTLRGYYQYNVDCSVTNVDTTVINQKLLYETTIEIEYQTRLTVTV